LKLGTYFFVFTVFAAVGAMQNNDIEHFTDSF